MKPEDASAFFTHISEVLGFHRKPPVPSVELSSGESDMWWEALLPYDFAWIKKATVLHRQHPERGRFSPLPADLIAVIEERVRAAWPSADEAWATALQASDESTTVIWSEESARALVVAKPILDMGDKVGARMAFKGAYDRELQRALREVRAPVIQISLGHDAQGRIDVLEHAVSTGRISRTQAAPLLEGAQKALSAQSVAIAGLITRKVEGKTGESEKTDEEIRSEHIHRLSELQELIRRAPNYRSVETEQRKEKARLEEEMKGRYRFTKNTDT